jgi:hypothetical protein
MFGRAGMGISVHYLASIFQPRCLAELGSDATVQQAVDHIVTPMISQVWTASLFLLCSVFLVFLGNFRFLRFSLRLVAPEPWRRHFGIFTLSGVYCV